MTIHESQKNWLRTTHRVWIRSQGFHVELHVHVPERVSDVGAYVRDVFAVVLNSMAIIDGLRKSGVVEGWRDHRYEWDSEPEPLGPRERTSLLPGRVYLVAAHKPV